MLLYDFLWCSDYVKLDFNNYDYDYAFFYWSDYFSNFERNF